LQIVATKRVKKHEEICSDHDTDWCRKAEKSTSFLKNLTMEKIRSLQMEAGNAPQKFTKKIQQARRRIFYA